MIVKLTEFQEGHCYGTDVVSGIRKLHTVLQNAVMWYICLKRQA